MFTFEKKTAIASVIVLAIGLSAIIYLVSGWCRVRPVSSEKPVVENTMKISDVTGVDPTIVDVVREANKHILLPDGKVTVATITNIEALQKQNPIFYQFAKNGDKLLIYTDRAILFSPILGRVLDVTHEQLSVQ